MPNTDTLRPEAHQVYQGRHDINKAYNEARPLLNQMVQSGDVVITDSQIVWGPCGIKTSDGHLEIKTEFGRFYGGGISDKNTILLINGKKVWESGMGESDFVFAVAEFARAMREGEEYFVGNHFPMHSQDQIKELTKC